MRRALWASAGMGVAALALPTTRAREDFAVNVETHLVGILRLRRSYDLAPLPRLEPAVCDDRADAIFSRRAQRELVAA